jgi:hypothetical protein
MAYPEIWLRGAIEKAAGISTFPVQAAESAVPPYAVYMRTNTNRERTTMNNAGIPVAAFTVTVYADMYGEGKELAESIRRAVDNFKGTASGVTIERCFLVDEADGDVVDLAGEGKPTFSVVMSFELRFREAEK